MTELPLVRRECGFERTKCACEFCKVFCRHMPGTLIPADLSRLCPPGTDVFPWAEQHLRALTSQPCPTLVPVRNTSGHCHWYFEGCCAVHENAPFGCAYFDSHMSEEEIARRSAALRQARQQDNAEADLYRRVWLHLCRKGLIAARGDRQSLAREVQRLQRTMEKHQRRARA
jgi:hypothetical protein